MNNWQWKPYGLYKGMYQKFYESCQKATGYDFGQGPAGGLLSTTVEGLTPLAWWSLDRPTRLIAIRQVRDQFLNDILGLKNGLRESTLSSPLGSVQSSKRKRSQSNLKEGTPKESDKLEFSNRQCSRVAISKIANLARTPFLRKYESIQA